MEYIGLVGMTEYYKSLNLYDLVRAEPYSDNWIDENEYLDEYSLEFLSKIGKKGLDILREQLLAFELFRDEKDSPLLQNHVKEEILKCLYRSGEEYKKAKISMLIFNRTRNLI